MLAYASIVFHFAPAGESQVPASFRAVERAGGPVPYAGETAGVEIVLPPCLHRGVDSRAAQCLRRNLYIHAGTL